MKKFLVFVMIAIVGLGIGFATFRFTVKQQVIRVDTTPVECNKGDTFALDVEIRNKKDGTTVTATSSNTDIVALSNTAGDEFKFEAKQGGMATITVSSNVAGFVSQEIRVTVGDGSSESLPLCISTVDQYNRIGRAGEEVYTLDKCYKLVADLSFNGNYVVKGNFSGQFNFANHRLSDITVQADEKNNIGLFESLASTAVVKNLVVTDFVVAGNAKSGNVNIGAVAGINRGIIRDVRLYRVSVEDGSLTAKIGAVAGVNYGTVRRVQVDSVVINKTSENSQVGAQSIVGGLVGLNSGSLASVYACAVNPNIAGGLYVGGVAGQNDSATVENCAVGALGSSYEVVGKDNTTFVGGLVGYNVGMPDSDIASVVDSYALVNLGANGNRGAIVGKNQNCFLNSDNKLHENPIFGCYYNQELTGTGVNAIHTIVEKDNLERDIKYGNNSKYAYYLGAKSAQQLTETRDTYLSYIEGEGEDAENTLWQFDAVWTFVSGSVPTLNFMSTAGVERVSIFIVINGQPGVINESTVSGDFFSDENANWKIDKNLTITSPINRYNAVMEGVKGANGYPTVTFAYSNFTGDWAALIGELGSNGHIKNLNFNIIINNVQATGIKYWAHLVAHNSGEINNCTIVATSKVVVSNVPSTSIYVGGIVAENKGQIISSNQLGELTVGAVATGIESYVGGIAAKNYEDANITQVTTGTKPLNVTKSFTGYIGGICGLSNSNISNAKNYANITMDASVDDLSTAVGGVVGKVEGRNIKIYQSGNFATIKGINVGGVVGISEGGSSASNTDIQVSQCMSGATATLEGFRVGGIVYTANCGLYQNDLAQNVIAGAEGKQGDSVVAGFVYKMNVNANGIVRAYNCVSDNTFGNAGKKYYEDANFSVFGRGNVSSILRGGYHAEPIAAYGCVDIYALNNCYAVNHNDSSVERTDGMDYEYREYNGMKVGSSAGNVEINAKSDHLLDLSNNDQIQKMKTATTERLVVKLNYFAYWKTGEETKDLTVDPFDAENIWSINVGSISLKAFAN